MRKKLGLFANVLLFYVPLLIDNSIKRERIEGTDLVFLRELTGGIYFGEKEDLTEAKPADTCTYTRAEVQRLQKKVLISDDTDQKNYVVLTKQMYWKPPVYERETVQAMEKI
jgi:3-isopropylmalate dehydrogenase